MATLDAASLAADGSIPAGVTLAALLAPATASTVATAAERARGADYAAWEREEAGTPE
jgi:hypothetical protein